MRFLYGAQDFLTLDRGEEQCWLLTDGLGGYGSLTAAFSANRGDSGLLVAARRAPNDRVNLVHRLSETLRVGEETYFLSSQRFSDGSAPEEGFRLLESFCWEGLPTWTYQVSGVRICRRCAMAYGENTVAVTYRLENRSGLPCTLTLRPAFLLAPKGETGPQALPLTLSGRRVSRGSLSVYLQTDGTFTALPVGEEHLAYPRDAQDGRAASGVAQTCCTLSVQVPPGATGDLSLVCSDRPTTATGEEIVAAALRRQRQLEEQSGFRHPVARQLAQSADAYLVRRDSTGGMTMIAGYPFFGDWGRDTMIALPGCVLATGRYEAARSILTTFLRYEKDGLVPNLFPEGDESPRYNSADAPLLLINCVWLYYRYTGDEAFVCQAWPVLVRIANAYRQGTGYAIAMDADGLIRAGEGQDQVTWMDVCANGHLPTPRHGKPVEINAYWYNALRILDALAPVAGGERGDWGALAGQVKASFNRLFWREEAGCLKDVLSGTPEEDQMRCNQIWAVTMPFSVLSPDRERQVVDAVYRTLYTPYGLRTLSPEDPAFHPAYGGSQWERDLAYHQGTVWPFPLGAFYLAWWKVYGGTPGAAERLEGLLAPLESALREGCVGQLPEIYDGLRPGLSQGCYAQAWSVGELLRVYELLEGQEPHSGGLDGGFSP